MCSKQANLEHIAVGDFVGRLSNNMNWKSPQSASGWASLTVKQTVVVIKALNIQ